MRDYLMFMIPMGVITLLFVGLYILRGGFRQPNALSQLMIQQYGPQKGRTMSLLLTALILLGILAMIGGWRSCMVDTALRMK